jgi:hypothetical protein
MKRFSVIVPGLLLGATLAAWYCFFQKRADPRTFQDKVKVWAWIVSGPFQEFWLDQWPSFCWPFVGIVTLAGMLAHPVRPNWATAIVTALALLVWFLSGLSLAFVGV